MATARRSLLDLKTEFLSRVGGINYSGWSTRADQLLRAAYVDIASLYAHEKLLSSTAWSVGPTTTYLVPIPSDLYEILGVFEYDELQPSALLYPVRMLRRLTLSEWMSNPFTTLTSTRPGGYLFGCGIVSPSTRALFLDVNSLDEPRDYGMFYQRRVIDPDFTSSSLYSELGQEWDEHILEHALFKAGIAIGDQQLAATNAQLFKDFVSQSGQKLLRESPSSADEVTIGANRMPSHKIP